MTPSGCKNLTKERFSCMNVIVCTFGNEKDAENFFETLKDLKETIFQHQFTERKHQCLHSLIVFHQ